MKLFITGKRCKNHFRVSLLFIFYHGLNKTYKILRVHVARQHHKMRVEQAWFVVVQRFEIVLPENKATRFFHHNLTGSRIPFGTRPRFQVHIGLSQHKGNLFGRASLVDDFNREILFDYVDEPGFVLIKKRSAGYNSDRPPGCLRNFNLPNGAVFPEFSYSFALFSRATRFLSRVDISSLPPGGRFQ